MQPPTDRGPDPAICECAVLVRRFPAVLQRQWAVPLQDHCKLPHGGVLGRDAVRGGGGDLGHLLQHAGEDVGGVLAAADLP